MQRNRIDWFWRTFYINSLNFIKSEDDIWKHIEMKYLYIYIWILHREIYFWIKLTKFGLYIVVTRFRFIWQHGIAPGGKSIGKV